MTTITEAVVEEAALAWLADIGWGVAHGPDIAPDTPNAERADYGQVVLERRLRDALAELNPALPLDALDDAFRKLTRPEGSTLEARNREFHRMLVNGVEIEYRESGGQVRGDLVQVIDFNEPTSNDLLAVNQFTPFPRTGIRAGRTWCSLSTAYRSVSLSSRTQPTKTPPSGRRGSSSRPTRPSFPRYSR